MKPADFSLPMNSTKCWINKIAENLIDTIAGQVLGINKYMDPPLELHVRQAQSFDVQQTR